jgi:hypothetical protein
MHSIHRRFGVLASLAILSVGAFSHSEIRSKEANVTMSFRETEMKLTNATVHWISPTLFQIEIGDNHDACKLSRIFNQELSCLDQELNPCSHLKKDQGIRQQRGFKFPVHSTHGPLGVSGTSEPTREIKSLHCSSIVIEPIIRTTKKIADVLILIRRIRVSELTIKLCKEWRVKRSLYKANL